MAQQKIIKSNKSIAEVDLTEVNTAVSNLQTDVSGISTNVQSILSSKQTIYYGVDEPSNSIGKDGDLYIRYRS